MVDRIQGSQQREFRFEGVEEVGGCLCNATEGGELRIDLMKELVMYLAQ